MIKKILLLSLPIAALAILSFQVVSADYYDYQGIRREGQPGPSEWRQLRTPPEIEDRYEYDRPPSLTRGCDEYNCNNVRTINPIRPIEVERYPQTNNNDEADLNIRKVRKYCVRDYCYIIYEICEENGRCVEEAKRVKKENYEKKYEKKHDWRDWTRQNTYKYFYKNYYYPKQDFDYVYRGTHYGRYYNRYWNF